MRKDEKKCTTSGIQTKHLVLVITKIGLGLSQLSNTKNKLTFGYKSKKEVVSIIKYAIKEKINFFDTANSYGETESIIGELKKKEKLELTIATKAGLKKNGKRSFNTRYLENQLDQSLRKLKIDRLNIFMLNKPTIKDIYNNDLVYFLEKLKKKGKIEKSGIIIGDKRGFNQIIKNKSLDFFSILFNLLDTDNLDLINNIYKHKKKVIIRSPLNSGLLSGKFDLLNKFKKGDVRLKIIKNNDYTNKIKKINLIKDRFNLSNKDLLTLSLSFVLRNKSISSVLVGCSSLKQIKEIIFYSKRLSKINNDKFDEIVDFSRKISNKFKTSSENF